MNNTSSAAAAATKGADDNDDVDKEQRRSSINGSTHSRRSLLSRHGSQRSSVRGGGEASQKSYRSSSRHPRGSPSRNDGTPKRRRSHSPQSIRGKIQPKSKAALIVRFIFAMVMVASAITVSLVVFFYTSNEEQNEFEHGFRSDADKIFQSIGNAVDTTLAAADNFVATIVAHKDATNGTFPFVALKSYALQAAKVKTLSKAIVTKVHYLIENEKRVEWEKFAKENNEFVSEAWKLQEQDQSFAGSLETFPKIEDRLFANIPEYYVIPEGDGPYLVSWQSYPVIYDDSSAPYNFDIFASPSLARHWLPVLESKRPTVTGFENVVDPSAPGTSTGNRYVDYVSNFIPANENPREPVVTLIYPIIDQKTSLHIDADAVNETQFVGTFSFVLFWRDLLRNILPDKSEGIHVVTETSCAQVFSYEINGAETKYISNKDVHDDRYDALQESRSFSSLLGTVGSSGVQAFYSGVPLSDAPCPITIKISPSQKYQDIFLSDDPVVFAVTAGLIFVLAG
eukprot:scaffold11722_cov116-Amphora_coffeaeformis.AAC.1